MNLDNQTYKAELRRSLLSTRRAISPDIRQTKSRQICHHLSQSSLVQQARTILAYVSFRQEPDLSQLFVNTAQRWGFPRCLGQSMAWHVWSPHDLDPMQPGAFGILEPHPDAPQITADEVDLILVPAIACDVHGYRLGYGGGFYDRMLSESIWSSKPTIGIVFEELRLPSLPRDAWDQKLTAVCTDAGLFPTA